MRLAVNNNAPTKCGSLQPMPTRAPLTHIGTIQAEFRLAEFRRRNEHSKKDGIPPGGVPPSTFLARPICMELDVECSQSPSPLNCHRP